MAQWNQTERILVAKLVYYGPAFSGKTTNLEQLHHLTGPAGAQPLLSVDTADDRTLFFDFLPLDLGEVLGYKVAIKVYTVPGQVRYDTTRKVVLAGADAVVFVADSKSTLREENIWSRRNLALNLRASGIDANGFPILYQFNKQDLPEAAPPDVVAGWFDVDRYAGLPAVAVDGHGVLETFTAAARKMLARIGALAGEATRKHIDPDELVAGVDRVLAPCFERAEGRGAPASPPARVVLEGGDVFRQSLETSVELVERLAAVEQRASRLEAEADALRRLSEALRDVGATFERDAIVAAALDAVRHVLDAPAVSLLVESSPGLVTIDRVMPDEVEDPLLRSEPGLETVQRLFIASGPCVIDELAAETGCEVAGPAGPMRAAATAPVAGAQPRMLVVYRPAPDGRFDQADILSPSTLPEHLAAGLEKASLHETLVRRNEMLEAAVELRTRELRAAFESLKESERTKDRFLANLSHEMKTPLTAVLSSAAFLRGYEGTREQRGEMLDAILAAGELLRGRLDDLLRLARSEEDARPLDASPLRARAIAGEAIRLAARPEVEVRIDEGIAGWTGDPGQLTRAIANLVDNAVKFSPAGSPVELRIGPASLQVGEASVPAVAIAVLDRGPGVAPTDRERIFAPFEQGGDAATGKPAGVGLGLHEARSIAARHGGVLELRPRRGGGSEFRVRVPIRAGQDARLAEG